MFELSFSLIKLLNTSTKRIFFSSDYENLKGKAEKLSEYEYLLSFEEGIRLATELTTFMSDFAIFEGNKLFGIRRAEILKNQGVIFMEQSIPKEQAI